MVTKEWGKVIEEKIAEAKSRGSKKRGWVKFTKSWLTSSINYRMEMSEQLVFSKLIVMADEYGPVPGLISDNDFRAMPHEYLAHLACCPVEIFEAALEKAKQDDSIFENGHGIFMTHFDDYQFTEYDRQRPYREAKKRQRGINEDNIEEKVAEVFVGLDKERGYRPPKRDAEASAIRRMLKIYTPEQILSSYKFLKQDKFWEGKELFVMSVESQIGAIVAKKKKENIRW